MTDRYADIRAALDAATPGPWFTHSSLGFAVATVGIQRIASDAEPAADPTGDIRYISACHPEAIRALLAERDALREALIQLVNECPSSLGCEAFHHAKADQHGDEGDCAPMFRYQSALEYARAALAQEQGGSDARSQ